jgi:hypothetical protein
MYPPSLRSAAKHLFSEARRATEDAAPRLEEPGVRGETAGADPATLPPIEPLRSSTKDDKTLWKDLPRAAQARPAERERSRDSDLLRR